MSAFAKGCLCGGCFCGWAVQSGGMIREIDIPPFWLALALAASWALGQVWPMPGLEGFGAALVVAGVGMMGLAVAGMVRARTTFVPRRDPAVLVTGGLFRVSRNPIYLADAMILTGAIVWWGAVLALPLVPVFILWITRRYILDEEARLRAAFGAQYEAWAAQVPRWVWRF